MLTLLLIFLLTALALGVGLYAASVFLQGYYYTEPTETLYWRGPAAGAILALFFALWCFMIVKAPDSTKADIPFGTIFNFNPEVDLLKEPAKELWAVKKTGEQVPYERHRVSQTQWEYKDKKSKRLWNPTGVVSIIFFHQGDKFEFFREATDEGKPRRFVSKEGWTMLEYSGPTGSSPTGIPTVFRWSRFTISLFLNLTHFLLWFGCLWLVLHFYPGHALGLGTALWLVFTLMILPMLLSYAADVAQKSRPPEDAKQALHMVVGQRTS